MDFLDYFAQLVGSGATGTNDPSQAGFSFPSLIGSAQAASAPLPPMPPQPPSATAADVPPMPQGQGFGQAMAEPGASMLMRLLSNPNSMLSRGMLGPPPASAAIPNAPPPMPPQPEPPPAAAAATPAPPQSFAPGGGVTQAMARFARPEPIPAPGIGGDISQFVRLPVGGQPGATPWTSGQMPAPAPQQAAPQQRAAPPFGALTGHIGRMEANPLYQLGRTPSTQPDMYDKLLRFGLAAMAAGGKPGANTLGALGEAGLSTVDAAQKAKQTDSETNFANRKLAIHAQEQISRAYERLEMLRQRAESATATAEDKRIYQTERLELQRMQIAMQAQGRDDTNEFRRDSLAERQRATDLLAADRTEKRSQADTAEARRKQTEADATYRDAIKTSKDDMGAIGLSRDQRTFRALGETAAVHTDSSQASAYQQKQQQLRAQGEAAIRAGKSRTEVNKMLQGYGLDPL